MSVGARMVAAIDPADPAEDRVVGKRMDHVLAEERLDVRTVEQGSKHLQSVPGLPSAGRITEREQWQQGATHRSHPTS